MISMRELKLVAGTADNGGFEQPSLKTQTVFCNVLRNTQNGKIGNAFSCAATASFLFGDLFIHSLSHSLRNSLTESPSTFCHAGTIMSTDTSQAALPIPEHISMEQTMEGLRFSYRWFSPRFIFLAIFALFWDGFLVFWYSIAASQDAPLMMFLFPILHVAVGIGVTYSALAGFYNSTLVSVGGGKLTIHHTPLPWPGNCELQAADLTQLYSEERIIRSRNGVQLKYQLNAITSENRKLALLNNLTAPDQVRYLERKIEECLGIADAPVQGELTT
jgi:hypothetical protein